MSLVLLIAVSNSSFGQYLNKLYDIDSLYDWGVNIFANSDGSYFVKGTSFDPSVNKWLLFNMQVSADGNTITNRHLLQTEGADIYGGSSGEAKKITSGEYISPVTIQWPNVSYTNSCAGLVKLSNTGDTVFLKKYTDTSIHFEKLICCDIANDGGYILGGLRSINTPFNYPGLVVRTNSIGDTFWTHTYQKDTSQWVKVNSVVAVPDGRIIVGAQSTHWSYLSWAYLHNTPWFLVLDNSGNILKDTLYGDRYAGGGTLYKDNFGGYVHVGQVDSLITTDPNQIENFPHYIAHLDTNFRIDWLTQFPYSTENGHRYIVKALQLHDSNFLVCGVAAFYGKNQLAWSAKIKRDGAVVWEHYYTSDSTQSITQFADAYEKSDGSLIFIGCTMNDTLPSWHKIEDVWLLAVDSNGCEIPGCIPSEVKNYSSILNEVLIYPNPTSDELTIKAAKDVYTAFAITNTMGQQLLQQSLGTCGARVDVGMLPSGLYYITLKGEQGAVVRKFIKL